MILRAAFRFGDTGGYWRRLKNHIHIQTYQAGIFDESSSATSKTAVAVNFHQLVALKPSNPVASK